MSLTVVIPTLNAGAGLEATLTAVVGEDVSVIVVDGGSEDNTIAVAEEFGARVVQTQAGRGIQLATGAACVTTEWMLFLHADTVLAENWREEVFAYIQAPENQTQAAVFRFALDADVWQAHFLQWAVAQRTRFMGLPYGDQGLLISKELYLEAGGFAPIPLMEDVDIVRRIGWSRLTALPIAAVTSAARWQKQGWICRSLRNLTCVSLYGLGMSPYALRRLYG